MGEEAVVMGDYELEMLGGGGEGWRVTEWETGLPGADELTPLSQPLVPPGLAAAFGIPPEPGRTLLDVHHASATAVSRLRRASSSSSSSLFAPFQQQQGQGLGQQARDEADSSAGAASSKRPRLVWTPQLHKRFVDVVAHLGIKNAVPKTIMQLMNVEGLTRENVASHLQKYRLYVKRMQGLSNEGPSPSDHLFASTPVPHSLVHDPPQVPYAAAPPRAMYNGGHGHGHHHAPMPMVGMVPINHSGNGYYAHGYPQAYHGDK